MNMNLSKVLGVCSVLGMLAVPALLANTVSIGNSWGPYQTGSGGEFTLNLGEGMDGSGSSYNYSTAYAATTKGQLNNGLPNIQTFCVEGGWYPESATAGRSYGVTLGSETKNTGRTLTLGAAYLYYNFAMGTLDGYDYGSGRTTSAGLLQNALWSLMGEASAPSGNTFYNAAIANGNALTANNGTYAVQVMNLWDVGQTSGTGYQDMLVLAAPQNSVPDGGLTVGMLGMALAGLATAGRKLRK
jgi:hypothetical protein